MSECVAELLKCDAGDWLLVLSVHVLSIENSEVLEHLFIRPVGATVNFFPRLRHDAVSFQRVVAWYSLIINKKLDGSGWRFTYGSEFSPSCRVIGQLRCKPFPALLVIAVNFLFDTLVNASNGSLQVLDQNNPRTRGLDGYVSMRVPFFVLGGSFPSVADVRRPTVGVCLSGSPDVLQDLVYFCFLS